MMDNKNISTNKVKTTLGEDSNSVANLCMSEKINKWSFWKPVYKETYEPLTEEDLYEVNDGFILGNSMFMNPVELWNNYITQPELYWKYEPTSGYHRLGDFRNYEHDAKNWFILRTRNTEEQETQAQKGSNVQLIFTEETDLQNISQFGIYPRTQDLDFGFLFYRANTTARTIDYYKQCELPELERMSFRVPSDTTDTELYILPVFSTDRRVPVGSYYSYNIEDITAGTFYLLPSNKVKINIGGGGQVIDNIYIEWLPDDFSYEFIESEYLYSLYDIPFLIQNNNTSSVNVTYTIEFNDISHSVLRNSTSVGPEEYKVIDEIREYLRLTSAFASLSLTLTIQIGTSTKRTSYTINKE